MYINVDIDITKDGIKDISVVHYSPEDFMSNYREKTYGIYFTDEYYGKMLLKIEFETTLDRFGQENIRYHSLFNAEEKLISVINWGNINFSGDGYNYLMELLKEFRGNENKK